jgi:hypothetical protein
MIGGAPSESKIPGISGDICRLRGISSIGDRPGVEGKADSKLGYKEGSNDVHRSTALPFDAKSASVPPLGWGGGVTSRFEL